MIINTGQRTDIPAFYAEWFANRLREGFVCVRNPYNPNQVSRYRLDPAVVDVIGFCTKNPAPMFPYMDLLRDYGQYWFVTITPYGRDIEPNVPDKHRLLDDFRKLSDIVGIHSIGWRYDPILVSERYTAEYHLHAFEQIAAALDGYTETVVISFIDLYPKVRRNFPEAREVPKEIRLELGKKFIEIASSHGMTVKPCAEGDELAAYGADCSGCMQIRDYEKAIKSIIESTILPYNEDQMDKLVKNYIISYISYMNLDERLYMVCRDMLYNNSFFCQERDTLNYAKIVTADCLKKAFIKYIKTFS